MIIKCYPPADDREVRCAEGQRGMPDPPPLGMRPLLPPEASQCVCVARGGGESTTTRASPCLSPGSTMNAPCRTPEVLRGQTQARAARFGGGGLWAQQIEVLISPLAPAGCLTSGKSFQCLELLVAPL